MCFSTEAFSLLTLLFRLLLASFLSSEFNSTPFHLFMSSSDASYSTLPTSDSFLPSVEGRIGTTAPSDSLDAKISVISNDSQTQTQHTQQQQLSPSSLAVSAISAILAFPFSSSANNSNSNMSPEGQNSSSAAAPPGGMLGGMVDPAEMSGLLSQVKSRKWLATIRPVSSFAGQSLFSKPRSTAEAMARLEANLPHFLSNYLMLVAVIVVITLLSQPSLLILGVLLGAFWAVLARRESIQIGAVTLEGRGKHLFLSGITGLVLFLFAGTTIFFLVGICASRQSQRMLHTSLARAMIRFSSALCSLLRPFFHSLSLVFVSPSLFPALEW